MIQAQKNLNEIHERISQMQEKNPFLPVSQIVSKLIREDIIACRLIPCTRLSEESCAKRYATSRTTIRKVFASLLKEGWLEKRGNHEIIVSGIHREDYLELMEFRSVIEPAACAFAAHNREQVDLKQIEKYMEMCNTSLLPTLYDANIKFHDAIFHASKNQYLIAAKHAIRLKMLRGEIFTAKDFEGLYVEVYEEHKQIFNAIRDGDEERAKRLGYRHVKMMLNSRIIRKPRVMA